MTKVLSKALLGLLLVFIIFVSLPGHASMEQASSEISFQDEQLEQAIKQLLKKDEHSAVTQKDMASLTVLIFQIKKLKALKDCNTLQI